MAYKHCIVVSPEMVTFVGVGAIPPGERPAEPVMLAFDDDGGQVLTVAPDAGAATEAAHEDAGLVCIVAAGAVRRLFGTAVVPGQWHLSEAIRAHVAAIRDCGAPNALTDVLRLARSIELFCTTFEALRRRELLPAEGAACLSEHDARRIAAARRMIDERWHEKLTLDTIARACGLNRGKLTRGFRMAYGVTIADALTERRLAGARRMLRVTDLPVSSIGYRCGYLNNASFTRAFSRHVGMAPTRWRADRMHAA